MAWTGSQFITHVEILLDGSLLEGTQQGNKILKPPTGSWIPCRVQESEKLPSFAKWRFDIKTHFLRKAGMTTRLVVKNEGGMVSLRSGKRSDASSIYCFLAFRLGSGLWLIEVKMTFAKNEPTHLLLICWLGEAGGEAPAQPWTWTAKQQNTKISELFMKVWGFVAVTSFVCCACRLLSGTKERKSESESPWVWFNGSPKESMAEQWRRS